MPAPTGRWIERTAPHECDRAILTPDQRLRVIVSSPLDLTAERPAARRAVATLTLTPVMFEAGARTRLARSAGCDDPVRQAASPGRCTVATTCVRTL